jgi:chemotaxis signal transduction protein
VKAEEQRLTRASSALRDEFDRSFAEAPPSMATRTDFLAVRIGGDPYALALADVAALHHDHKVVPIPSRAAELLGIAGFRGLIAPVYDLGALLGYGRAPACRFLFLARGRAPVALAFERFEGHLRLGHEGAVPATAGDRARSHLCGAVRFHDAVVPLIDLGSVLEVIAGRVRTGQSIAAATRRSEDPPKER